MSEGKISFSQVKLILKKRQSERSPEEIQHLQNYFSDNAFFQKHEKENGEKSLQLIYSAMKYEYITEDKYVMRIGEFGTTYYIILKGEVEIRIPTPMKLKFLFKDLMKYVLKNFEWIIKNEASDKLMEHIYVYFPECQSKNKKNKGAFDKEVAMDILYGENDKLYLEKHNGNFPRFLETNEQGEKIEVEKEFEFTFLKSVIKIGNGSGFGELALLNDKPRSATIITLVDTHFAVLEKEDFNKIMAKAMRNKFASQVQFLSKFSFLSGMTRIAKEKL